MPHRHVIDQRTVRKLRRELRRLRAHVRRLERSLAVSIATRELVVSDVHGRPRVWIRASEDHGAIDVVTVSPAGHVTSSVELFATDDEPGSPQRVGVVLTRDGDIVGGFEMTRGRAPELWIEETNQVES